MIKEVSFSILMSALKPAGITTTTGIDSSQFVALSSGPVSVMLPGSETIQSLYPVQFCGEDVPLHQTAVTRRWVTVLLQQSAHREYLFRLRKRASTFFPVIEPILAKYRIPRDFKFLPLVESNLMGKSVSPKGAAGYWQLMPQTARDYGLIVERRHDERKDLQKATVAACRYLRELHQALGSWTLVAAAYNSGITHVQHRMQRQGGNRSYYNLRLHRETRWYLYRVLAYKELLTRPRMYRNLLRSDMLANLIKPLPEEHPAQESVAPSLSGGGPPDTDPTWGPRTRDPLKEVLAQVELDGQNPDKSDSTSMATVPVPGRPSMAGLMALCILRFRRTRLHQIFSASRRRFQPLFDWDWI